MPVGGVESRPQIRGLFVQPVRGVFRQLVSAFPIQVYEFGGDCVGATGRQVGIRRIVKQLEYLRLNADLIVRAFWTVLIRRSSSDMGSGRKKLN